MAPGSGDRVELFAVPNASAAPGSCSRVSTVALENTAKSYPLPFFFSRTGSRSLRRQQR